MQIYFLCTALFFLAASFLFLAESLGGDKIDYGLLVQALGNVWGVIEAFSIAHEPPLQMGNELWATFIVLLALDLAHAARFFVAGGGQPQRG